MREGGGGRGQWKWQGEVLIIIRTHQLSISVTLRVPAPLETFRRVGELNRGEKCSLRSSVDAVYCNSNSR